MSTLFCKGLRMVPVSLAILFLFGFLIVEPLQASTTGAGGSGKPLLVKMRKDVTEQMVRNAIRSSLGDRTLSTEIPFVGLVSAEVDCPQVLMSRRFNDGSNERYEMKIFLSINGADENDYISSALNNYSMEAIDIIMAPEIKTFFS